MREVLDYNTVKWVDHFYYAEDSPSGLRRVHSSGGCRKDNVVGKMHYQKDGRPNAWVLKYKGVLYQVHRVIWVLIHGNINSELYVNHIDTNPFNNLRENLEVCSPAENNRRCSQHIGLKNQKNNTTGVNGVSHSSSHGNGREYFIASWHDQDGKKRYKYFSIKKLGRKQAFNLVVQARKDAIENLRKQGFGYPEELT